MNRVGPRRIILGVLLVAALTAVASLPHPLQPVTGCVRRDAWAHDPWLFWAMQLSDGAILAAYLWIPVEALDLRERLKLPVGLAFVGVAAFVLLCGLGHGLDIVTAWHPIYWLTAEVRIATAAVSLAVAAGVRWYFKPHIMELATAASDRARAVAAAEESAEDARAANIQLREALSARDATLAQLADALAEAKRTGEELMRLREAAERRGEIAVRERAEATERATELETILREKQELLSQLEAQRIAVQHLGTVIIRLRRERPVVLAVPIQGMLDSRRMQDLQESVASRAASEGAEAVILDLTGVAAVDTAVAACLLKTADILGYMGCQCIITGMRAGVATSVACLGVALPRLTFGELCDGLAYATRVDRPRRPT